MYMYYRGSAHEKNEATSDASLLIYNFFTRNMSHYNIFTITHTNDSKHLMPPLPTSCGT